MNLSRSSGILLHPTSLPGGRLGREAEAFVDWLAEAGQSWWQVLPLGPPDPEGSPYAAASAFAGWPGLLAEPDAPVELDELEAYVAGHAAWIGGWARFAGAGAIADQVRFDREWRRLRAYAAERGVRLIGDMPLYVAPGSADERAHPELFQRGAVAGVPPDYFSRTGQRWGNPLYDWETMRSTGFRWWIERFRRLFELVDLTRVDHFRGLVAYWSVPAHLKTAKRGSWRRAPGRELFAAVEAELGDLPVIAEDLGLITEAVERLRDELGLPGMHVFQFGAGDGRSTHHPDNFREHAVAYTGTHDNDTTLGWWGSLRAAERRRAGLDPREPHWDAIGRVLASRARLAVVPAQDVLGLGSEARMNVPGRVSGNWRWQLRPGELTGEHAERLRAVAAASGRAARTSPGSARDG